MSPLAIRWWEAHPVRWQLELDSMMDVAPALAWSEELGGVLGGGWAGDCPRWPFRRPQPVGLDDFADGRVFSMEVRCSPAHPIAVPTIYPVDPEPDLRVRTAQAWHVLGDGGLCLVQHALDWTGRDLASELVVKAAGWYLEYLLLTEDRIDAMTVDGIVDDDRLDALFVGGGSKS